MNKNIPLMLDSSTFKQVPRLNSQLFKELVKYTRANIYKIYISEIVEQEFLSWIKIEAQDAFDTVTKATASLKKYHEESNILGFNLGINPTALVAENQINGILKKATDNWIDFKEKTNTTITPILEHHGKLVMDAYFRGDRPFSKIKNRLDIPDAFIYFSMKELLKHSDRIIFISSDKKFSQCIQDEQITCFSSLSDLFSNGPSKLDNFFFNSLDKENRIFTIARIYEDEIHKKLSREIELSDLIENAGREFITFAVGEHSSTSISAENLNINTQKIMNISELSFLIPFSAKIVYSIESVTTKEELSALNNQRLKNIEKEASDNGDYNVSETYNLSVTGHFSLKIEDSDPSSWKEQKKSNYFWSEYEINEISVSLEDVQTEC